MDERKDEREGEGDNVAASGLQDDSNKGLFEGELGDNGSEDNSQFESSDDSPLGQNAENQNDIREEERKQSSLSANDDYSSVTLVNAEGDQEQLVPNDKGKLKDGLEKDNSYMSFDEESKLSAPSETFIHDKRGNKIAPRPADDTEIDELEILDREDDDEKKNETFQRANGFLEFATSKSPALDKVLPFKSKNINDGDDSDAEGDVYPLSKKFDRKKCICVTIQRYFFLIIILYLLVPLDIYYSKFAQRFKFRIGYYADMITEESISISGVSEFQVNPKNCIVRLLETTGSDNIDITISSSREAEISFVEESGVQIITITDKASAPQCYVEMMIPGGASISKLKFSFDGDKVLDLLLFDYKDGSTWENPLKIGELELDIGESFPNVFFSSPHEITTVTVNGNYCNCNFSTVKIKNMDYNTLIGSLNILQNSEYSENSVTVNTAFGTHCVAGDTVNVGVDANCPSDSTRASGITALEVPGDTSTYCSSSMFICSDSATS